MGIFWTRQKKEAWEYAKEIGYLEGNQKYIPSSHIEAYKWMMEQMEKKIPKYNGEYPIWLFLSKPQTQERFVILEIELDEDDVLLSDFYGFQFIINNCSLINENDEEYDEYLYAECDTMKEKLKRKSWDNIFDLNRKQLSLQGTTGRVELSKVIKVYEIEK
ncbi:DUF3841 domain-containing protein [Paenibacillus elgii]|uniref:DUF3841 domain-containing protein n=1 Tax=Paenibacillus elgii TaxID=189691 RepID=UPI00203F47E0|nr:DUF3841 domain-containing protein [Paenibacillus elgii]MCM3273989.1 DUF3841 domain-containing protein [Paenibacillus elgii]